MKQRVADICYERLKTVIIGDKGGAIPHHVTAVLEADLKLLLSGYFDLKSVEAQLDYDGDGELWLKIFANVDRVKPFERIE